MTLSDFEKSYANFSLERSFRQLRFALRERSRAGENMRLLYEMVDRQVHFISECMGRPIENMNILEIGPGQGLERARYLGRKNHVDGLDRDIIPTKSRVSVYLRMLKENGAGRVAKTIGRKLIVSKANEAAWAKLIGVEEFTNPNYVLGDICVDALPAQKYDLAVSWSVFEHLPDPRAALKNVIQSLAPGGGFFISLHLWTSLNGSHDIRLFTGHEDALPLWGHLRPSTRNLFNPSSYLNCWRLAQWRELFLDLAPGVKEVLEKHQYEEKYWPLLTPEQHTELKDFTEEELFTVDATYFWKKPVGG